MIVGFNDNPNHSIHKAVLYESLQSENCELDISCHKNFNVDRLLIHTILFTIQILVKI